MHSLTHAVLAAWSCLAACTALAAPAAAPPPYTLAGLGALLNHHILGSPSLWFDRGQPFEALQRHAKTHTELAAQVRIYVGGLERPTRQRPDDDEDMVAQLQRYVAALRAQRRRALDVQATILDGEDHATAFPRLITQGLMWALPKPASGNSN